ncbi:SDR family oxidoreductase [Geodermatophilus chilensis]|uniref:SDR family oxidoreductase n=1 Tax=Geodermatophilus chilensis TaxID=2035835 RepID=UPI000C25EDB6|nr:SDR family oxidoreductase [Geodermatophilus chilensis]
MSQDQFSPQDPTSQYVGPDALPEQQLEHPGLESDMDLEPDYGESTYRGSGRLEGKRALITGGDSGIGRAVALAYAREGADVLISYLPEEEDDAQVTARVVRDGGRTAVTAPGDVRDEAFCQDLVERTVSELGGLDVLVSNAAYQMSIEGIEALSTEQLLRTYHTNVFATFWLCKAAVRHMQPGSSIIITTSIQAYQPSPSLLDYASTKGALVTFTKGLSQELAPKGIRVNTVAPGPIWTPLIPATMPAEQVGSFGAETPIGRAGQPAELAPAYVFLAAQESSYITGERIGVTGGMPMP